MLLFKSNNIRMNYAYELVTNYKVRWTSDKENANNMTNLNFETQNVIDQKCLQYSMYSHIDVFLVITCRRGCFYPEKQYILQ